MPQPTTHELDAVYTSNDMFGVYLHVEGRHFFIPRELAAAAAEQILRRLIVAGDDPEYRITKAILALTGAENG